MVMCVLFGFVTRLQPDLLCEACKRPPSHSSARSVPQRGWGHSGQCRLSVRTKVAQLEVAILVDQKVLRLEVSKDRPETVAARQGRDHTASVEPDS